MNYIKNDLMSGEELIDEQFDNAYDYHNIPDSNASCPCLQRLGKEFDTNSYFNESLQLHHFLILKAMKIKKSGETSSKVFSYTIKIFEISFFWKVEKDSSVKLNSKVRNLDVEKFRLQDAIFIRLHKKRKNFMIIVNQHDKFDLFFNKSYHEKLNKLENPYVKTFSKCVEGCWLGDCMVLLTSELQIIAFNTMHETLFFVGKSNLLVNSLQINLLGVVNPIKIEKNTFLMKNDQEDALVIYIDKNVFVYNVNIQDQIKVKSYSDIAFPYLFSRVYKEFLDIKFKEFFKKIGLIQEGKLNSFKLFEKSAAFFRLFQKFSPIDDQKSIFHLKHLQKFILIKVLDHLNFYKKSINFKFFGNRIQLSNYPFFPTKQNQSVYDNDFLTKSYLFFTISLTFLWENALFFEKKEKKEAVALGKVNDFIFCEKILEALKSCNVLKVLSLFQEKNQNMSGSNKDIHIYCNAVFLLTFFLKKFLIYSPDGKNFLFFSSFLLKDFLKFQQEKKCNVEDLFKFLERNSFTKIKTNDFHSEKLNLLNIFIFLLDYMSLHNYYIPFLNEFSQKSDFGEDSISNLFLSIFLIIINKNSSEKNLKEIFEKLILYEKMLDYNTNKNRHVSLILSILCFIFEKKNETISPILNDYFFEKVGEFFKMKLKLALRFLKKQNFDDIFNNESWKDTFIGNFLFCVYENANKGSIFEIKEIMKGMNFFFSYFQTLLQNSCILIALIFDKPEKKEILLDHKLKDQVLEKISKTTKKILKFFYYVYLKMKIRNFGDVPGESLGKILIHLKILKNFYKFENRNSFHAKNFHKELEEYLSEEKNLETLSESNFKLLHYYLAVNEPILMNLQPLIGKIFKEKDFENFKEIGEEYDKKSFEKFINEFLKFLLLSYKKTKIFIKTKEKIDHQNSLLEKIKEKYSKIFKTNIDFFYIDGKWRTVSIEK